MIGPMNLSERWPIVKLDDVVEFLDYLRKPVTAKDRVRGPYPYYGANGQQDSVDKYIFDEPLILLAEDGGHFGSTDKLIAYQVDGKCWVNNHAHVLRPRENVYIRYLCRHLEKYDVSTHINGATRQKLNKSAAKEILISLPPLEDQKRIAAILDKADSIRRKRQAAIELADQFLRSVFLDMFGDPVTNPKGWDTCLLGDILDVLTDYHANGSYQKLKQNVHLGNRKDYALMLRTTDLEANNFESGVKWISKDAYNYLEKSKVYGGEIIINKIGSAGAVYLMPDLKRPVSLAMNQFLLRCNNKAEAQFAYHYLKTDYAEKEIAARVRGAVTKTITKEATREIPFYLPTLPLQIKFSEIADTYQNSVKERLIMLLVKEQSLSSSLAQKAFKGELTQ